MSRRWIRNEPGKEENTRALAIALGAAAAVALVTFYFARILVSRDEIEPLAVARERGAGKASRRGTPGLEGERG